MKKLQAKQLGARLCAERVERGYSVATLAQLMRISEAKVKQWEAGYAVPDALELGELARLYCVSVDVLLWGATYLQITAWTARALHKARTKDLVRIDLGDGARGG